MKTAGLCSVTFRNLSAEEIISLAKKNALACIEWGGDIHVPPEDLANAERVGRLTRESGISTLSYGSYFKCGKGEDFDAVSRCAKALGANIIRVWSGTKSSKDCSEREYKELVNTVRECARIAASRLQTVAFEYHGGTYTDTPESALKLLKDIGQESVKCYWQPAYWFDAESQEEIVKENLRAVKLLKEHIVGVHVYQWVNGYERRALIEGQTEWAEYLKLTGAKYYDLEFVKDDSKEQFISDAKLLTALCGVDK